MATRGEGIKKSGLLLDIINRAVGAPCTFKRKVMKESNLCKKSTVSFFILPSIGDTFMFSCHNDHTNLEKEFK